ncbi:DUF11 domain-containing protein [Bacillus toyonensis]|uniref:DUF11 domain-containing protein n=1 Tax=Bacillus toyonensis TaxID=155322 RepID=UPI0018D13BEF|nr:DUF11 domain-containing protein [Bacillus toyonensis]MBH0356841.1 hypothetical protein [Bacillus toyonensis biovar Thuringiensis]
MEVERKRVKNTLSDWKELDLFFGTTSFVSATKSVDKDRFIHAGDELTYKVNVKNYGGDIASDSVLTDAIPDGTEYVSESIKVMKSGTETSVTDAVDNEIGDFQNNKVTVKLGDFMEVFYENVWTNCIINFKISFNGYNNACFNDYCTGDCRDYKKIYKRYNHVSIY